MDDKKQLPEIGKTYKCYDDGKIHHSRQYDVDIIKIIPWNDASDILKDSCKFLSELYDHLYNPTTDYFIAGISHETDIPVMEMFVRSKYGDWFGMGEMNGIGRLFTQLTEDYYGQEWCSGLLDVDNKLTEELENKYL